nr:MAG TPA: hypothetical protein [Caudoviricetes sp.]
MFLAGQCSAMLIPSMDVFSSAVADQSLTAIHAPPLFLHDFWFCGPRYSLIRPRCAGLGRQIPKRLPITLHCAQALRGKRRVIRRKNVIRLCKAFVALFPEPAPKRFRGIVHSPSRLFSNLGFFIGGGFGILPSQIVRVHETPVILPCQLNRLSAVVPVGFTLFSVPDDRIKGFRFSHARHGNGIPYAVHYYSFIGNNDRDFHFFPPVTTKWTESNPSSSVGYSCRVHA